MTTTGSTSGVTVPQSAVVVGAGIVGLSTAWHLLRLGVDVVVIDRDDIAAGSSWGNAGFLTPDIATPLPEPAVLRYGLKALVSPRSPLYVPIGFDPQLWNFLLRFATHCTSRAWRANGKRLATLNRQSLEAFAEIDAAIQQAGDASPETPVAESGPFTACFNSEASRKNFIAELDGMIDAGQEVDYHLIDGEVARDTLPVLSHRATHAVEIRNTKHIDPPRYMEHLARDVQRLGGVIRTGTLVQELFDEGNQVVVRTGASDITADIAVIATGAHLGQLAQKWGVKTIVRAGRGYSFSVELAEPAAGPVYFPGDKLACTPLGDGLRVAGMMEFRRGDEPFDPRRIKAVARAAAPWFNDLALDDPQVRADEWVGSRPCTPDGLPLIGRTSSPRIAVAGGHGLWGVVQGPITGKLLAQHLTGPPVPELTSFDPLR